MYVSSSTHLSCFLAHLNTSMHCQSVDLNDFLLGRSSPEQMAFVESHLSDCAACQLDLETKAASSEFWLSTAANLATPVELLSVGEPPTGPLDAADSPGLSDSVLLQQLRAWCDPPVEERSLSEGRTDCEDSDYDDAEQAIGRVGKYLICDIVGHGGMGVVLRAIDRQLHRTVAIKTLLHPAAISSEARDRLIREARAVASLKHEHVIAMHSIEQWRDVPFIVMPFVEGGTLLDHSRRHDFTIDETLEVARQLSIALIAAHERELVHRDIKPSNVLLENGLSHVVLADFGLARVSGDITVTQSGMAPGTPQFMSPEQAVAESVDHRSDQFSLGSVMYWMTTGRYPFQAEHCYATLMKLANEPATPISKLSPEVPDYLERLINRMMSKNPDQRFSDMHHVGAMIEACIRFRSDEATTLPQELAPCDDQQPPRVPSTTRLIAASVATLVLIGSVAIAIRISASKQSSSKAPAAIQSRATKPTESENKRLVGDPPFRVYRDGPLDDIEISNALDDLGHGHHLGYWLARIADLPVDDIPPELTLPIRELATHQDPGIHALVHEILERNPFVEVQAEMPIRPETNPFEIVPE